MYQALYRSWRPTRFADIVGQQAIVRTLLNQIKSGRISHAYLFCGSRGTGKTSTAKTFARALNCLDPHDGEPCGECAACRDEQTGASMDVLEIDAASNNGVDEIRDLRDKIMYPPAIGKYRVYIIDEVHMLSAGAFNALLKTLEEPPAHAVFILATTEPQKLPATILSRCQRFDFHRIRAEVIVEHLRHILVTMNISAAPEALEQIALAAEGGMRDAISLMDLCMSYSQNHITAQVVQDALGTAGSRARFDFADALAAGDAGKALTLIDELMRAGREPAVFAREMTRHLRGVLVACACPNCAELLDVTDEDAQRYRQQAEAFGSERALRAMDLFAHAEPEMRWASQPRMQLEMAAIRACRPSFDQSVQALTERIDALERKLESGAFTAKAPSPRPAAGNTAAPAAPAPKKATRPVPEGDAAIWKDVLRAVKATRMQLWTSLKMGSFLGFKAEFAQVSFEENNEIFYSICLKEENHRAIEEAFTAVCQKPISVQFILNRQDAQPQGASLDTQSVISVFGRENVDILD